MALPAVVVAAGKTAAKQALKETGKATASAAAKEVARGAAREAVKEAAVSTAKKAGKEAATEATKNAVNDAMRAVRNDKSSSSKGVQASNAGQVALKSNAEPEQGKSTGNSISLGPDKDYNDISSGEHDLIGTAKNDMRNISREAFSDISPSEIVSAGNKVADDLAERRTAEIDQDEKTTRSNNDNIPKPRVTAGSLNGLAGSPARKRSIGGVLPKDVTAIPPAAGGIHGVLNNASNTLPQSPNNSSASKQVDNSAHGNVRDGDASKKSASSNRYKNDYGNNVGANNKPGSLKNDSGAPLRGSLRGKTVAATLPVALPLLLATLLFFCIGGCALSFGISSGDGIGSGSSVLEQSQGVFIPNVNSLTADSEDDSSKSSQSGAFSGEWCYYDQHNPNWDTSSNGRHGIGNWDSGCGVVSYAMVLSTYSKDAKYTPNWCVDNGLASPFGGGAAVMEGAMISYVNDHQDIFHLKAEAGHRAANGSDGNTWKDKWDRVKSVTNAGGCVMISSNRVGTTSGGHYVVLTKVENGTVTFKNPWGGKEETASEDYVKNAGYDNWGNTTLTIWFEKV